MSWVVSTFLSADVLSLTQNSFQQSADYSSKSKYV